MRHIANTPGFYIREFSPEEEYLYLNLYADDSVTRFINERSEAERRKHFAEGLARYNAGRGFGRWAIFNRDDDDFIGACRLEPVTSNKHRVELGYVLHQKYWGRGIATELVKTLVDYTFKNTGATGITALTHLSNFASQKVLEKAAFKRQENVFREGEELAFFMIVKVHQ